MILDKVVEFFSNESNQKTLQIIAGIVFLSGFLNPQRSVSVTVETQNGGEFLDDNYADSGSNLSDSYYSTFEYLDNDLSLIKNELDELDKALNDLSSKFQ